MISMMLGPLSSASPNGQGPFFSWVFVLVGGWILVKTWMDYTRRRNEVQIPRSKVLGVSALALGFVVIGVWGLIDQQ